jgi:hypothetical protein
MDNQEAQEAQVKMPTLHHSPVVVTRDVKRVNPHKMVPQAHQARQDPVEHPDSLDETCTAEDKVLGLLICPFTEFKV